MTSDEGSTIENRVYLFKDLASAWLRANSSALTQDRTQALAALADLARVACEVADGEELSPEELAERIRRA